MVQEFASLIAGFLKPEIAELYLDVYDVETTAVFTNVFDESVNRLGVRMADSMSAYTYERFRNVISPSLKVFNFEGTRHTRLGELWEIVGKSLEKVNLTSTDDSGWATCMNGHRVHCRKLSSIFLASPLSDPNISEADYEDFLVTYGSQLMKTDLSPIEQGHSTRVARECVNARCSVFKRDYDFSLVNILQKRVASLCLLIDSQFIEEWIPLLSDVRNCSEMETYQICDLIAHSQAIMGVPITGELSEDFIRAALPMKMPLLKSIKFIGSFPPVFVDHVAALTSGLKTVHLETLFPVPVNSFVAICRSNPELEDVVICENSPGATDTVRTSDTKQIVGDLLRVALRSKALRPFAIRLTGRIRPGNEEIRTLEPLFSRFRAKISVHIPQHTQRV